MPIRGTSRGEVDKGEGDKGITKLKTKVISAAAEKKQRLLLGEACLAACSRGCVQPCGMTLHLNFFCLFVCSCQIQRRSICTGRRSVENVLDCMEKLVPVDTVVRFDAHIDWCNRDFVLNPFRDRQPLH